MPGRTGLLLLNLGTPDAPDTPAVRRYLREFLSDPRVVDISPIGRWLLLNLIILPFRPAKSAAAYRKVWTPQGSPLMVNSLALRDALRTRLCDTWQVELGMRYGNPSTGSALAALEAGRVNRIVAAPLYPQQASSSTGTALEQLYRLAGTRWKVPILSTLPPFHGAPGFLDSFAAIAREQSTEFKPDYVLFSFHGLPERHLKKGDPYQSQCMSTASELAARLGLKQDGWSVSFQSRLGRTPWIKPHTDAVLPELATRGIKRVMVMSPSFVADCLETLEEMAIRGHEQFTAAGGEDLRLVPSLNADPRWVEALAQMVLAN